MALPRARMRAALAAALAVPMLCAPAQAQANDLWVAGTPGECATVTTGAIYAVNPVTHLVGILTAGDMLRKPLDVAASPDGTTVFVADKDAFDATEPHGGCASGHGGIIAVDTTTGAQSIVSNESNPGTTWGDPASIAYDATNNRLIVLDRNALKIYSVNLTTHSQLLLVDSGFGTPQSVLVKDGTIYVLDDTANSGAPQITKVNEGGSPTYTMTPVSTDSTLGLARDMAFAANGDLIVFSESVGGSAHPGVVRVDLHSGSGSLFASTNATEIGPTGTLGPSEICGPPVGPLTPYNHPVSLASDPGGTAFFGFDSGPTDPQWCPTPASGTPPTDGLVFSIDGSNGAGNWVAGGTTPQPWIAPAGMAVGYNRKPHAAANSPTGSVGDPITIDASSSSDPDGDPLSYRFDLDNDGVLETTSSAPQTSTTFSSGGDHTVGVEVSDGFGGVDATTTVVHVQAKPPTTTTTTTTETTTTETPTETTATPDPLLPATPPNTTLPKVPAQVTLGQVLANDGVTVPLTCTTDCTITGTLTMSAKDFKNLTAASRQIVVGTGTTVLKAGKNGKLRIRLTKKAKKQLIKAFGALHASVVRKIKLNLTLSSKYKSGKKKTIRRKIILKG